MNDKEKLLREHGMKSFRTMMIICIIAFVAGPFLFWNQVSKFGTIQLIVYLILHIVCFGGSFCLFLYRYNKYKNQSYAKY